MPELSYFAHTHTPIEKGKRIEYEVAEKKLKRISVRICKKAVVKKASHRKKCDWNMASDENTHIYPKAACMEEFSEQAMGGRQKVRDFERKSECVKDKTNAEKRLSKIRENKFINELNFDK